jgi:D-alanyl-D-alanine carboxypeptidase (penicillin-binding protein 5/6)
MDESRFFTMSQLWQSLALTVVIGGVLVGLVTFGITHVGKPSEAKVTSATTTAPQNDLPAAAIESVPADPFSAVHLSGKAAIVVDLSTGNTLYSQNADAQLPLASLTKLLTLYEAQHVLQDASLVTISSSSLAQDGDYGLMEGETFKYSDLARFALVPSSNDAAEAIAEAAEAAKNETPEQFMQDAVRDAGLSHTIATNGTGLDIDATEAGAYGTARDIAKLASSFLRAAPEIARATTKGSVSVYSTAGTLHTLPNTNPDVGSMPGILLSKTGYTDLAGGNLAVVFDAGINHQIAIVVLGSTRDARFTDVEKLMHATLQSFTTKPL